MRTPRETHFLGCCAGMIWSLSITDFIYAGYLQTVRTKRWRELSRFPHRYYFADFGVFASDLEECKEYALIWPYL